ncbi:uncharacterized protein [Antedon mediterranea]|uniref:uncharacterized protein isoform X2 n=1 Tax=Antedon mediterranea TaxID=105859 RepID=UPI003AF8718B
MFLSTFELFIVIVHLLFFASKMVKPRYNKKKRTDDNQWWELFDNKMQRFYYYNATTQKTVWRKPAHSDIIPLAKLQKSPNSSRRQRKTLKTNTEAKDDSRKHRSHTARKHKHSSSHHHRHHTHHRSEQRKDRALAKDGNQNVEEVTVSTTPRTRRRSEYQDRSSKEVLSLRQDISKFAKDVPTPDTSKVGHERQEVTKKTKEPQVQHAVLSVSTSAPVEYAVLQPPNDLIQDGRNDYVSPEDMRNVSQQIMDLQRNRVSGEVVPAVLMHERRDSDYGHQYPSSWSSSHKPYMSPMESPSPIHLYSDSVGSSQQSLPHSYLRSESAASHISQHSISSQDAYHTRSESGLSLGSQHSLESPMDSSVFAPTPSPSFKQFERQLSAQSQSSQQAFSFSQEKSLNRLSQEGPRGSKTSLNRLSQEGPKVPPTKGSSPKTVQSPQPKKRPHPRMGILATRHQSSVKTGSQPRQSGHIGRETGPPTQPKIHLYDTVQPLAPKTSSPRYSGDMSQQPEGVANIPLIHDQQTLPFQETKQQRVASQELKQSKADNKENKKKAVNISRERVDIQKPESVEELVEQMNTYLEQEAMSGIAITQSLDHQKENKFRHQHSDSQLSKISHSSQHSGLSLSSNLSDSVLPSSRKLSGSHSSFMDSPASIHSSEGQLSQSQSIEHSRHEQGPIYENVEFQEQKQIEKEQLKKLRELDMRDSEKPFKYPERGSSKLRPRSRTPSPAIFLNGSREVKNGLVDIEDSRGSDNKLDSTAETLEPVSPDAVSETSAFMYESDQASPATSPTLSTHHQDGIGILTSETVHASLRRTRRPENTNGNKSFDNSERSVGQQRPSSMVIALSSSPTTDRWKTKHGTIPTNMQTSSSLVIANKTKKPTASETELEKYAVENLNKHKKGIFRKPVSLAHMLSWTKEPIKKPMLMTRDKEVKREALESFKLIQCYMSDKKLKGFTRETSILELTTRGWKKPKLRDEIFIQLCKQTTDNRRDDSLMKGWEIIAVCLSIFPPTTRFYSYLEGYLYKHLDGNFDTRKVEVSRYASYSMRKLERVLQAGARKGNKKITTEEIELAKRSVFHPSMFGSMLDEVMELQKDRFPDSKIPWVVKTLSNEVIKLGGEKTEGIFRIPGDIDEVNALKVQCDTWMEPSCKDPNVPASLLKLWYRELYEPLIPFELYDRCIECKGTKEALHIVSELPEINRLVLNYFIRFLQKFVREEIVTETKMDENNLAMVMAPNCLRCDSDDPTVIFENARKEMAFVRTLIRELDTSGAAEDFK